MMEKFGGYIVGVLVAMALTLGLAWYLKGPVAARMLVIFFLGWIMGAISMFIKAWIVYKR